METIGYEGKVLCYIISSESEPTQTNFLTPSDCNFQIGFVVYPAGGKVTPHVHLPVERHIVGTSEVLIVKKGSCEIEIYNDNREFVAKRSLRAGDIILAVNGGHGFRMQEDTVLLEIKQGPYTGLVEKERF
jgi:hypothetical protein